MIERKLAKELMRQFGGMPQMPTDPKEVELRTSALIDRPRSESHARSVVDHLVSILTFFPTVSDIAQACGYIEDPAKPQTIISDDEQQARVSYLKSWYAQEEQEAAERRAAATAAKEARLTPRVQSEFPVIPPAVVARIVNKRITGMDFDQAMEEYAARKRGETKNG